MRGDDVKAQWPQISFPAVAVQLMAYPIGQAMSRIPYPKHWPLAEWINPGPFNIKEHTMITIMSTVGVGAAYATGTHFFPPFSMV